LFLSDIKDLRDLKNLKPHFIDALESRFFIIETIIDLFVGETKNQFFASMKENGVPMSLLYDYLFRILSKKR